MNSFHKADQLACAAYMPMHCTTYRSADLVWLLQGMLFLLLTFILVIPTGVQPFPTGRAVGVGSPANIAQSPKNAFAALMTSARSPKAAKVDSGVAAVGMGSDLQPVEG